MIYPNVALASPLARAACKTFPPFIQTWKHPFQATSLSPVKQGLRLPLFTDRPQTRVGDFSTSFYPLYFPSAPTNLQFASHRPTVN